LLSVPPGSRTDRTPSGLRGLPTSARPHWYVKPDGSSSYDDTGVTSPSYSRSDDERYRLKVEVESGPQTAHSTTSVEVVSQATAPQNLTITNRGAYGQHPNFSWGASTAKKPFPAHLPLLGNRGVPRTLPELQEKDAEKRK
jgi:hypothetical protein